MSEANDSDIAIVGMAIRVPDANGPDQYWANLKAGLESVRNYTDEELLAKGVSRATLADPHYVKSGIPLQDLDQFDPEFFGFSPKEAGILDPQHRHFYEVCWEAMERAGHTPDGFTGSIGLFAGCGMGAYFTFNLLTNPDLIDNVGLFLLRHTGNDKDFLATRVSYAFNLQGPSVNVQTACSTSLVATHMAVQSLLSGECDMALAGGVTIEFPHGVGYHYKEGEVLSPDGHCRSFDHRSKGTVFGSGAGVVVLRRLADALADGDHIHAVIKGSAVNNDGSRKVGYLAPSVDGQAACIAEALAVADIDADSLSYVECHGTATPVGDPIEIAALTQAFRASSERVGYCKVGSVKTNIGHLDTAAGVASLIKASLALEHQQIPPSLNFEAPNPRIGFEGSPFVVAQALADWQRGATPRRAGVNSLGVGGTNAFVVLQEPPARPARPADAPAPQLLLLSARNRKALDENGRRLAAWLRDHPDASLADAAWTLKVGRRAFEQRRVLAAANTDEAIRLLEEGDAKRVFTHSLELERPRLAFMFPGGGAQYVQMGRDLYEREPVFRRTIDEGLAILKTRFGADLAPVLLPQGEPAPDLVDRIGKPSAQLPLTFLVEIALTRLWAHYGVQPQLLIGHSMGENAAACVAGVFSFEDGLGLLLLRGQLVEQTPPGGMVSVPMAAADLQPLLGTALDLASANSPQLSVASGPTEALDALSEQLKQQGIDTQRVRVNVAGHSRLLDVILPRFRAYLQSIKLSAPTLPIVSNHTGKLLAAAQATDPEYWVQHFRHAILFADGVDTLLANDDLVYLEVGPGNMLGSFVRQNPRAPGQRVLSSMRHPQDATPDDIYFRTVMGRLWALGIDFDTGKLWGTQRRRLPLPTYAFQHARYWIDPGVGGAPAQADTQRPLKLAELGDWFRKPRWVQQGVVELDETPHTWLAFVGRDALSRALVARLREAGQRVVTVLPGDAFAQVDEHGYTLAAEAGGAGYQDLLDALVARELAPDRVLHGWLVTLDRAFRPGSTFLHRNQEHGFYSLFHLARALSKSGVAEAGLHLTVLANGAQRVGDEPLSFPDKATALGPCAVIPREFPAVSCAFVDIDLGSAASNGKKPPPADAEAARVAAAVADELFAPAGTRVIAWRNGVRWQRHLGTFKAAAADAPPRLRQGGSYLITGGLGGIGGELAEWLAREAKAKLVLVGRTPLPQRSDWDDWLARHKADDSICRAIVQVRRLESLGATVLPLAADVAVADSMGEALAQARQAFGPLHGVFHAAGVIRDSLIALKSPREIEDVFAAKIYGTLILDELLRETPLDFMILFSSTSAYVAPAGQVDYVGASAFVNAFAESCRGQRRYPVTAIAWGVWKDVGLVGTLGAPQQAAASADAALAHAEALPVHSAQFERRYASRDGVAQQHVLTGTLSAEADWVIDEHRLGSGEALLPGTGYLELIRAALAEIGHAAPWQLSNLVFEAPLFVPDGAPRRFRVSLRGDEQRWDVELLAETADGHERCASARIVPPQHAVPAAIPVAAIDARCQSNVTAAAGSSSVRTRQEAHLRFGPRWRVLKRLQFGEREALARLQLAGEFAGDLATHGLHPGVLDIATGCAMDLIPGYASQDVAQNLWAPISYRGFVFHAPLEAEIVSWIRLAGEGTSVRSDFAAFDVTLAGTDGRVLAEVEQLTLRRLDGPWHAPRSTATASAAEDAQAAAKPRSPGEQALHHNVSQGIAPAEGMQALARLLAGELPAEAIISSMRVDELILQAEGLTRASSSASDAARFSRPELDSDFAPPRDAVEKTLAELWGKLLGVEGVGIRDSFFDLGGHSLIAVRLFNEVNDKLKVDLPMSVLMQSPTIEGLATLVRGAPYSEDMAAAADAEAAPAAAQPAALRFRHVVPMHSGPVGGRTPLFVVAGMFGNVLNLSHLAHLLGEERPFYALQARGLYGDASPHESFEEAAADYIAEVRQVQSQGPYLLGGFSGGGLIAYEMARQLIEAGEQVQAVLMLDTPAREIPRFSLGDKVAMLAQSAQREGLGIVSRKIGARIQWETEKRRRRSQANGHAVNGHDGEGELNFQSRRIGDAFTRGLVRYRVPKVPVKVAVFRPKLDVRYRLSGGRLVDSARNYVREDNFWTPYTQDLQVFEVPGNHDNMVLEPNVRVLVSSLRRVIDQLGRG